jgi:hypothetical protein
VSGIGRPSGAAFKVQDQFVDLAPGRYSILAQKKGCMDFAVGLITVAPGQTVVMADITMRAAP